MNYKRLREEKGWTQTEVADKMEVSMRQYQRWESGEIEVPRLKKSRLQTLLTSNVTMDVVSVTDDRKDEDLLSSLRAGRDNDIRLLRTIASNKSVLTPYDCEKVVSGINRRFQKLEDHVNLIHNPERFGIQPEPKNIIDWAIQVWKGER